uniref:U1-type domain-containing protein n=2 Tax=Physcomitrium patens TaxID=3218 RepID=A0A7I4DF49_PHYPA
MTYPRTPKLGWEAGEAEEGTLVHFLLLLLLRCRRRRRVDLHQVIPLLLSSPLPPSPLVLPLLLLLSLCLTPPVTPFTELDPNWIMVWFQCESCGENLKKPKLQGHFRGCAARKLSCIDCGVVFDQQSVQVHTSCVTETEKYGPKDGSNGSAQKPKSSQAVKAGEVDLSIGLSTSPPWNCSLCKVNATSYETLEGHSQGKKHRAKAKAAQAKIKAETEQDCTTPNSQSNGSVSKAASETNDFKPVVNGNLLPSAEGKEQNPKKRRKVVDAVVKEDASIKNGDGNKSEVKDSAAGTVRNGKPIKWKKLATKALLKVSDKRMKIKELMKELLPSDTSVAEESDKKALEKQLITTLSASSKFEVNGKWVTLVKEL